MSNHGPGGPYRDRPQDPWQGRPPQEPYDQPSDPWGGQDAWGGTPTSASPDAPGSPTVTPDPGYGAQPGYGTQPGHGAQPGYGTPGYEAQPGYGGHGQGQGYEQGFEQGPHYERGPGREQNAGYGQDTRYGQGYAQEPGYGYAQEPTYHDARAQGGYEPGYAQITARPVPPQPAPPPVWSQPVPAPPRRGMSTGMIVLLGVLALLVFGGVGIGLYLLGNDPKGNTAAPGTGATAAPTDQPSAKPSDKPSTEPSTEPTQGGSPTDARFAAKGQCLVNKGTVKKPTMQITDCAPGTYQVLARFDGTKDYQEKCGSGKVPGYQYYYFFDSDLDTLDFVLCLKKR